MKATEEIIGEAIRIEIEERTDKVFLVFDIVNEQYKQDIKKNWTKDIELRIINRKLVIDKGE